MSHQGGEVPRLVAVQGELEKDGTLPVYRHPSDESPPLSNFSKTVLSIKAETEKHLGHPLNHVLIQYYRTGNDYISEHSDKTLDIVPKSFIANVSLGAERTMVLRTKRLDKDHTRSEPLPENLKRKVQRARLPHNSLCRMGLKTNMKWLHSIRQDKRADREKLSAELAFGGARISLTFRQIGTFLNGEETLIWGQGARGKQKHDAHGVINGQTPEAIDMLRAFGTENHSSSFDWDEYYGNGFDVLHMKAAPRLFASADPIVNMRIALLLAEKGINYSKGSSGRQTLPTQESSSAIEVDTWDLSIKFVDNDDAKSIVEGELAILLYIDARDDRKTGTYKPNPALLYTRFQRGLSILSTWRRLDLGELKTANSNSKDLKHLRRELRTWNEWTTQAEEAFGEKSFVTGVYPSLPDFALWPVLHDIFEKCGTEVFDGLDALQGYYERFKMMDCAQKVLRIASTTS
jgi:alkylated DNA repair dioxygenase AlkB